MKVSEEFKQHDSSDSPVQPMFYFSVINLSFLPHLLQFDSSIHYYLELDQNISLRSEINTYNYFIFLSFYSGVYTRTVKRETMHFDVLKG